MEKLRSRWEVKNDPLFQAWWKEHQKNGPRLFTICGQPVPPEDYYEAERCDFQVYIDAHTEDKDVLHIRVDKQFFEALQRIADCVDFAKLRLLRWTG